MEKSVIYPFSHPLYVMVKPVGAMCNLACRYCYYLEKKGLYEERRTVMSEHVLENFIRQYIGAQTQREVLFVWHGGEPLMLPVSFYENALRLQRKYAGGHVIDNCIQTNGTLLTDEWCRFLSANGFLVGVSIDGNGQMHDMYRRTVGGSGTFSEVMRGIDMLVRHGVEWNAMSTVNSYNVGRPVELYRFFRDIGCRYIQFTPVVERTCGGRLGLPDADGSDFRLTDTSVSPEEWGVFLCEIFDEWVRNDVGEYFVQLFDATLANWAGVEPGVCSLSATCGNALAMEYNGDLFSCDHFVFPEYLLGNIGRGSLIDMGYGEAQNRFRRMKTDLPQRCRECEWRFLCNGECPKNRFVTDVSGERGVNYLCDGYRKFFSHSAPYMKFMCDELAAGRAPSNVMRFFSNNR
ncbi:anaerobic sulfatase-maturation protein [Xylanibacter muris]|uniref:Anaerobic sulfatase-maturation protein n=1 Tax=Xylanibacter muris TaxID=2736290 RepID=A0ABX2ANX1_9BACT|nr:anaerobic sulfatase-maturation protein [Xylanibacter muris]NPD92252.1 anaerobic sulfatase-maturation protein [Xylanibacter muris]